MKRPEVPLRGPAEVEARVVETVVLTEHNDGVQFEVDGVVVPFLAIDIAVQVGGRVNFKSDGCRTGRSVKNDDLLFRIDSADYAVVAEGNVFTHRQMGNSFPQAAIDVTSEVILSVTTAVLTTVVEFAPLLFVSGTMGKFTAVMSAALIAMLFVASIECVTILPCHLAHKESLVVLVINIVFCAFKRVMIPRIFPTVAQYDCSTRASIVFIDRLCYGC